MFAVMFAAVSMVACCGQQKKAAEGEACCENTECTECAECEKAEECCGECTECTEECAEKAECAEDCCGECAAEEPVAEAPAAEVAE